MHKIIVLSLFSIFTSASFSQQVTGEGYPVPPVIKPADASPPIPIVKGLVDGIVKEKAGIIMTPEQIELLKSSQGAARQAVISPYPNGKIAKPVSRSYYIDGSANQEMRLVRLSSGVISTFVFSDANGTPWLVKNVSLDCRLFSDGVTCGGGAVPRETNIVKVWATTPYSYGNIVVELEGHPTTVMFMLAAGQSDENDVSVNVRVAGRNPNATPQTITLDKLPDHDSSMGYFLDGVPPPGASKLKVSGGDAEAWLLDGALYLRTRMSVLSPAFTDKVGSADGISVFKYFSVVPQLLASVNGKTTTLYVTGY